MISEYFPEIPTDRIEVLQNYVELIREWNSKINLVSRKDIDAFEQHHLAHCLAITPKLKLMAGTRLLDVGTGGGLPGIPLAIMYPQAQFVLVDSIGKKIRVVEDIVKRLDLKNVECKCCRVEEIKREFDFVLGRAVTNLALFCDWIKNNVRIGKKNALENGLLYWRGGNLDEEIKGLKMRPRNIFKVRDTVDDAYFDEKYILHFLAQDLRNRRGSLLQ